MQTTSVCNQPPRPTQPPTPCGTGNVYQSKCGDILRLASKGRHGSFHLWINMWVAGKSVLSFINTNQPGRLTDEYCTHYKALYKCAVYLLTYCLLYSQTNSRNSLLFDNFRLWPGTVQNFQKLRCFGPHSRVNVSLHKCNAKYRQ